MLCPVKILAPSYTCDGFEQLIERETNTVELKTGVSKLQEPIVAFSNGQGGVILSALTITAGFKVESSTRVQKTRSMKQHWRLTGPVDTSYGRSMWRERRSWLLRFVDAKRASRRPATVEY
jgi:hypothetical protein